jgi:hypothetical protein
MKIFSYLLAAVIVLGCMSSLVFKENFFSMTQRHSEARELAVRATLMEAGWNMRPGKRCSILREELRKALRTPLMRAS